MEIAYCLIKVKDNFVIMKEVALPTVQKWDSSAKAWEGLFGKSLSKNT